MWKLLIFICGWSINSLLGNKYAVKEDQIFLTAECSSTRSHNHWALTSASNETGPRTIILTLLTVNFRCAQWNFHSDFNSRLLVPFLTALPQALSPTAVMSVLSCVCLQRVAMSQAPLPRHQRPATASPPMGTDTRRATAGTTAAATAIATLDGRCASSFHVPCPAVLIRSSGLTSAVLHVKVCICNLL